MFETKNIEVFEGNYQCSRFPFSMPILSIKIVPARTPPPLTNKPLLVASLDPNVSPFPSPPPLKSHLGSACLKNQYFLIHHVFPISGLERGSGLGEVGWMGKGRWGVYALVIGYAVLCSIR